MSTKGTRVPDHLKVPFAGVTPAPDPKKGQTLFPTGNWRYIRPVYKDKLPPCNNACPAGEKIQGYLDLVKEGRYRDAYALIKEDMPFPSITGRVCYHPCETACNRGQYDEPIAIRTVERFLGDYGLALPEDVVTAGPPTGQRVAIVGSGPGGLSCAYHLARLGHAVTIFEALPKAGGLLRGGMPEFVLPQEILDQEIARIEALGVEIRCNARLGREISWDDLKGYDAAFLAVGLMKARPLPVPGAELPGVVPGLNFLLDLGFAQAGHGAAPTVGERVAVIGGGNTAIDCVRAAVRMGAQQVVQICFEAKADLPASAEEQELAEAEGAEIWTTTIVKAIVGSGRVESLRIARVEPGAKVPADLREVPNTEETLPIDTVIVAIGQFADLGFLPTHLQQRGLIGVDQFSRVEGNIFAGGDVAQGPGMVVQVVGAGKKAAQNIDRVLQARPLRPVAGYPVEVIDIKRLNLYYFIEAPRRPERQEPVADRIKSLMIESHRGYTEDQAVGEADRCFSCGTCNACDNCYIVCPDASITRDIRQNGHYAIWTDYCKGCGVCIKECPTGCLETVPELEFDDGVVRMETAFATEVGAHGRQQAELEAVMGEKLG